MFVAPSRRNSLLASTALAAWASLGLLGHAEAAETPCAKPEIQIQADQQADIDIRKNIAHLRNVVITQCNNRIEANEAQVTGGIEFENAKWSFSGNVRIKAEGGSLSSEKAIVSFHNKLISEATITGDPAEFVQVRDDGTTSRGHAKTIDYETSRGTVSFRKDAWLSDGCNEIKGDTLTYNIRAQRVEGQKTPTTQTANGRITITIQPKDADGQKPCSKPAGKP
jgi:lipopolysaccharide transport protein LptA